MPLGALSPEEDVHVGEGRAGEEREGGEGGRELGGGEDGGGGEVVVCFAYALVYVEAEVLEEWEGGEGGEVVVL